MLHSRGELLVPGQHLLRIDAVSSERDNRAHGHAACSGICRRPHRCRQHAADVLIIPLHRLIAGALCHQEEGWTKLNS